jgi:hypothetical protein
MGTYHATLAGTLLTFLFSPMSSSSIFFHFAYIMMFRKHDIPPTWHLHCEIACSHFDLLGFSTLPILMDKQFS